MFTRRPRNGSTAPTRPELAAFANIGILAIGTGRAIVCFVMALRPLVILCGDNRWTLTVSICFGHWCVTAVHAAGLSRLLLLTRTNPTLGKLVTNRLVHLSPRRILEGTNAPG